ncbi:MAG: S41 family peptidase [Bacteroidales bacterium]|jgi:hypothetical protein|nr:S41 family peptidase [Bacteroidales bacterium]
MKKALSLGWFLLIILTIHAQHKECIRDFNTIVHRIQYDYPGYADKVNDKNLHELKALEQTVRKKIKACPDSCKTYMDSYVSWFKDKHLRISVNRQAKRSTASSSPKKYYPVEPEKLTNPSQGLEGIWTGFWGKLAIIKQDTNHYTGIALDYRGYDKHQVIFEGKACNDSLFFLTTYWNFRKFNPHQETASLQLNHQVLEIHDYTRLVRQTDDPAFDQALLSSYIPCFPNGLNTYPVALSLSDSTFYLRIPTFYSDLTEQLVTKHWDEIMGRPNLIIDIRNNSGGQDYYYDKLAELIYTGPYESKNVEWYASRGLIKDLEDNIKQGHIKEGFEQQAEDLLARMKTNVGGFVLHPYAEGDSIIIRDTIYPYPRKAGIILNENNASSAEQFLLTAQHSRKVITFGAQNTAGILDYSNITPKELPSGKYHLWLPATRSGRLPENPIDNTGIAPEVKIPLEPEIQLYDRLDQWVYFVQRYLEAYH